MCVLSPYLDDRAENPRGEESPVEEYPPPDGCCRDGWGDEGVEDEDVPSASPATPLLFLFSATAASTDDEEV